MDWWERPKLRKVGGRRVQHEGRSYILLEDPHGLFSPQLVTPEGYQGVLRHCDGETHVDEIRRRMRVETRLDLDPGGLRGLFEQLDQAMVLDGPTYQSFLKSYRAERVRPAALAGRSYDKRPPTLTRQLHSYFDHARGSGRPNGGGPNTGAGRVRGVLSPHIDFYRGGPVYSWAYKALRERCDAEVFVIMGVAHQGSEHRFALTRKHFATPLGEVQTDQEFVGHLLEACGEDLLDDELTHRTEHSIEFQAVFLQHVLGPHRPFTIVPVLVGSFHDLMRREAEPIEDAEVAEFVEALRKAEARTSRRVAYVGGIDLAHIGPQFGDPSLIDEATAEQVRRFDTALLDRAVQGDAKGWFAHVSDVEDRWRVCGTAATYTMLHAMGPARGTLLSYDQAINPDRTCGVTFASVAYET
jgi:AmmeMemoRadiSam system protein B